MLSKLHYSVFKILYDTTFYRKGNKIIAIKDNEIVSAYVECQGIQTQKEIDELQIDFNNLKQDLKAFCERGNN